VAADGESRGTYLGRDADRRADAAVLAGHLARAGVPAKPWERPPNTSGTLGGPRT
jgi:hypothetical protein